MLVACHQIGMDRSTTSQYEAIIRLLVLVDSKGSLEGSTGEIRGVSILFENSEVNAGSCDFAREWVRRATITGLALSV